VSPVKQAAGTALRVLDPSQKAIMDGPRGGTPKVGAAVTLWRLPGAWSVWSEGPTTGTWWLVPRDDAAWQVVDRLRGRVSDARPDVTQLYDTPRTCAIAVTSKAIRAGGR
jgi:hypothetical protein